MILRLIALSMVCAVLLGGCGGGSSDAPQAGVGEVATWTCAMHPQIQQSEPGDCPICGMDLIPAGDGSHDPGAVLLSERARALSQLRTAAVARQADAAAELRLLGRVEVDETTLRRVTAWTGGRIDRLHVNVTGEQVRAGQVVATLYSPEIYKAQQDLITAQQQVERLSTSPEAAQQAARAALEASRLRLRLLGVPDDEIERMAAAETPQRSVKIRSPFGGTVIERLATEGAYVETGAQLYQVADLSRLWVQLDAYEGDLTRLAIGQPVRLTAEGLPGATFEGEIAFIDPTIDSRLRTAKVRVQVDEPGTLRPGMFAEAVVTASDGAAPLVIPATAPLFTGRRSIVYVEQPSERGGFSYTPRTVRLGPRLGEVYPVVAGLSAGERVVTRGAFAIDADLQIRGGPSMMSTPDDTAPEGAAIVPLTPAQRDALVPVMEAYLGVQIALAEDDLPAAAQVAGALATTASVRLEGPAAAPWSEIAAHIRTHAAAIEQAGEIEVARAAFEPLSLAIEAMLRQLGNPLDAPVQVAFCPMASGSEGARWVQQGDTVDNSYFGASMRSCGEITAAVDPGTYLDGPTEPEGAASHDGHDH